MKTAAFLSFALLLPSASSWAGEGWEVTFLGGWTAPTVEERVVLDVEVALPEVPATSFEQRGEFALVGRGAFAFGGSMGYFFNDYVGIEARVDTVDFQVEVEGPQIFGATRLPPPLPPLETTLDLSVGALNVERLYPLSANLKLRTGGRARFFASGGMSFLPRLRFSARQEAALGVVSSILGDLPVATVAARADALSDVPAADRVGFNGGAGLEVRLSETVAFVGDARVFGFPTQTLSWRPVATTGSEIEEILLEELLDALAPVELELIYFQVSAGLALRF